MNKERKGTVAQRKTFNLSYFSSSRQFSRLSASFIVTAKKQMFKNYKYEFLKKDILSGVIVSLISIPISMGYAQVAGLPVVYGLYGSLFPVIIFGLLSSSPQFVFGVDAAPAALVGGTLASLGIAAGSDDAMRIVPVITFVTALWLILFALLRAGKLVGYISKPVLGGFISGIASTIILMQTAKLFGGASGTGEIIELIIHIVGEFDCFNWLSCIMGIGTIIVILVAKKLLPKFPMSVVMLVAGALSTMIFHVDQYGVKLLPRVEAGLPVFKMIDFSVVTMNNLQEIVMGSLTIALVIVSSTLLTANNYAIKNDYKIQNNREIFSYAAANLCAALNGCCPLNGSVSRTAIAEQFGVKSQVMSLVAGVSMIGILLFGTGFIAYLPVPVLTGIVLSALIGILEIGMAKKLWNADKREFLIFLGAFLGVLIFGTIYGVIIGVILSFISVIIKAAVPPREMLGVIPGQSGFYSVKRNRNAHPICNTVIYRFSGTLFFANIGIFQQEIEEAIKIDTRQVIVDASGMTSIDITAADRLLIMADKLAKRGVKFYLTEHVGGVNDQLRQFGAGKLIEKGHVRRTIELALQAAGVEKPYVLEDKDGVSANQKILLGSEQLAELEWAFGEDAQNQMEKLAIEIANEVVNSDFSDKTAIVEAEEHTSWGKIGLFDEDEILDRLELYLMEGSPKERYATLEERIEERRTIVEKKLMSMNPETIKILHKHRRKLARQFEKRNPIAYKHIVELRREHIAKLEKTDIELAEKLKKLYAIDDSE